MAARIRMWMNIPTAWPKPMKPTNHKTRRTAAIVLSIVFHLSRLAWVLTVACRRVQPSSYQTACQQWKWRELEVPGLLQAIICKACVFPKAGGVWAKNEGTGYRCPVPLDLLELV